ERGGPVNGEVQGGLFAWLWAVVVICFFSFSPRQEYYSFPAFPALALLAGAGLARGEKENSPWALRGQGLLAFVGVTVGAALGFLLWLSRNATPAVDISQTLTHNPENYKLAMGHMSDLPVDAFAVLRVPAAGAALSLSVGFLAAFILRRKGRAMRAGLLTAVTTACFIYFAHMALGVFNPYLSSQPLAEAIKRRLAPGDMVVLSG